METPSSTRRLTRSQTLTALSNNDNHTSKKTEDSEKEPSKSRPETGNQDRSALIDITNDSPIVGLARGRSLETPISSISKQRSKRCKRTPGSGEALLRGQVKNLLQRVEEEEAHISKFSLQSCGPNCSDLKAFLNFPAGILAPKFESFDSVSKSRIEHQSKISQVECGIFHGKPKDSEKDEISRSLFLEFSEKSDSSSDCSSVVTEERESHGKSAVIEDDDASIWSIQVNASTREEDEQEDELIEDYAEEDEGYGEEREEEEEEIDMLLLDELCEGISKITFKGKHKRFVYNSDDELVEEHQEFCGANDGDDSGEVLRLNGLATPEGKHLHFQDDEDE